MAAVCECLLNGCRFASSILPMHYISKRRHVIIFSKMASTRLPLKTSSDDVCLRRGRATPKVAAPLVTSCLFEMGNDYRSILKHFPQLLTIEVQKILPVALRWASTDVLCPLINTAIYLWSLTELLMAILD